MQRSQETCDRHAKHGRHVTDMHKYWRYMPNMSHICDTDAQVGVILTDKANVWDRHARVWETWARHGKVWDIHAPKVIILPSWGEIYQGVLEISRFVRTLFLLKTVQNRPLYGS